MKKLKYLFSVIALAVFSFGLNAQEVKVTDGQTKTDAPQVKSVDESGNVNFSETVAPTPQGQAQLNVEKVNFEGMVVGDKQQTNQFEIGDTRPVSIEYKSNNPNALYYITDRLGNLVIPATELGFNETLRKGIYLIKVGLTPEAIANGEKAQYNIVIQ